MYKKTLHLGELNFIYSISIRTSSCHPFVCFDNTSPTSFLNAPEPLILSYSAWKPSGRPFDLLNLENVLKGYTKLISSLLRVFLPEFNL